MAAINGITKPQILLVCLMLSMITMSKSIFPKVHVKIQNLLDDNLILALHCKSKNDDLGQYVVPYNGTYEFRFTPNVFGTTLFHCSMEWNGASNHFDIYSYKRDDPMCENKCSWIVMNQGPCLLNVTTGFIDMCYDWNPSFN